LVKRSVERIEASSTGENAPRRKLRLREMKTSEKKEQGVNALKVDVGMGPPKKRKTVDLKGTKQQGGGRNRGICGFGVGGGGDWKCATIKSTSVCAGEADGG